MTAEQVSEQLKRIYAALTALRTIADADGDTLLQESVSQVLADLEILRVRKKVENG